jgi:hypothetical protein
MGLPSGSTLPRSAYSLIFQGMGKPNIYPKSRVTSRYLDKILFLLTHPKGEQISTAPQLDSLIKTITYGSSTEG